MKQLIRTALLVMCILPCLLHRAAAADIHILIDEKPIQTDVSAIIENDRVMVPVRGVLESLGYRVRWDAAAQTVSAVKGGLRITLPLNSNKVSVNGKAVEIDAPAMLYKERTLVPLRFLAEYSGAQVLWDEKTNTVSIRSTEDAEQSHLQASVVLIQTNKMMGSGVILSADGLLVTNFHVIENASVAVITLNDNSIYSGDVTVVGLDPERDLALLKIQLTDLTPAQTSETCSVGERVTAIGSPDGDLNKVTTGEILSFDADTISASAEIAKGSSGGGLFNAEGKLIGITSAMGNGQYLSIPIAWVTHMSQTLSIPIAQMQDYTYPPHAPQNLRCRIEDGYANISWSPIYGADYYIVETASQPDGPFQRLVNTKAGRDYWYWGHPQCFGISIQPNQTLYLRVFAVVDGVETEKSAVLEIHRP